MGQGRRGRAKAGGPVDQRGAAYRTALQNGDGAVLAHPAQAFLVETGVGLILKQVEVTAGLERAFLDQQYLEACGAEHLRAGGAAGTAAYHGNVGLQAEVLLQA
ncbi:hypothetical protein D3C79_600790 [compost metagenome]